MRNEPGAPTRAEIAAVTVLALAGSALASVRLGQDLNVDLLHYHFYNGYAFLAGRIDRDIAPAGVVSYFNPLLDAVHYLGMRCLQPRAFAALLGAFQGLNLLAVWALGRLALGREGLWLAPLGALLAGLGQDAVSLLGTTFADTTVSVPVLAGLVLLLGPDARRPWRVFTAALLAGAAVGLKPTTGAAFVGLASLVLLEARRSRRLDGLAAFVGGTAVGWTLTNGWWALTVWRRFGNPFYPLFNNVFRSPFAAPIFRLDPRWGVQQRVDWLRPPIDAALGFHERLQEVPFRDPRLLLPFLALILWLFVSLARRNATPLGRPARSLLTFWFVCYATWLGAFYYYRYGAVLELLAPLVALLVLREVLRDQKGLALAAALLALVLVLATNVNQWGRGPWKTSWFPVRVPELGRGGAQLVVLCDVMLSFAVPYFPADSSFVGVALPYGPATDRLIRARIDGHRGPLLLLARTPVVDDRAVSGFGLTLAGSCEPVRTGTIGRLTLCPLARVDPRGP